MDDIVQILENKKSFTETKEDSSSLSMFMTEEQRIFRQYSETFEFAAYLQKVRMPEFYALPVHHKFSVALLLSNYEACNQLIVFSSLEKWRSSEKSLRHLRRQQGD